MELVDQEDQVVEVQMINHQIQKELEAQVLVVKVMLEVVQHQEDQVQDLEELVVVVEKTLLDLMVQDVVVELVEQEFQFQVVLVDHR
jgi:altronate dehydratase|tara:strand:- start:155 stop:415 length:261 start_codon:yes stop_codon:yes gene_type:complete